MIGTRLRIATAADSDPLGVVMFRAIHEGDSPYTKAQRTAWLPKPNSGADWAARLLDQHVLLAQADEITGFMSVTQEGYVDLAYILPEVRGQGLFAQLLEQVEAEARGQGAKQLTTHASLMAQPAFQRCGFVIDYQETVARNGQTLARARMCKNL